MTKTIEKTVNLKNGHEMTESNLNGLIKTMCNRLATVGLAATGMINLPESDIVLKFTVYEAEKMRHALHDYRYKTAMIEGKNIYLNLY